MNKTYLTCEQFIDRSFKLEESINNYIQDSFYSEDFSPEVCLKIMIELNQDSEVLLTDLEDFDYDGYFSELYTVTEKGLS